MKELHDSDEIVLMLRDAHLMEEVAEEFSDEDDGHVNEEHE